MYVKQLELTRFKSFGGTVTIPLLPGFTVVSGPNGSGKSNIIDGLLFSLGLATSRGMRAERLPDLVHSASLEKSKAGRRTETWVSVTFAIPKPDGEAMDWKVTRRLRVNAAADSYTSTYYINDIPCTLTELHEQLSEMHIYPDGYNVVLQGDVTGIISMNAKERRQIIDELAGVANFDRKIDQAKTKLEAVREQEERSGLVMRELEEQSDRLIKECEKAEKYQKLRLQLEEYELWREELTRRHVRIQIQQAQQEIEAARKAEAEANQKLEDLQKAIAADEATLNQLNQAVRQLGEAEYLDLQSELARAQAKHQQQQGQIETWTKERSAAQTAIQQAEERIRQLQSESQQREEQLGQLDRQSADLQTQQQQRQQALENARAQMQAIAQSSDAWAKQHRYLSDQLKQNRQLAQPYEQSRIRLSERLQQLERQQQEGQTEMQQLETWLQAQAERTRQLEAMSARAETEAQTLGQQLADLQSELELNRATAERLRNEWQAQQRQLDKLETRQQVLQETRGSRAVKVVMDAGLAGVCGLVAQLGQVDPKYQLAVEIAAGGRLNHLVVETDEVASRAIAILKQKQAGRATFLPLNKLKEARPLPMRRLPGAIDYAFNLMEFDSRYRDVFAFVFGQTLIFESLDRARSFIGQHRIVTLDGELLETSGAMTGGANKQRHSVHFGAAESREMVEVRRRYEELSELLEAIAPRVKAQQEQFKQLSKSFNDARDRARAASTDYQKHLATTQSRQERFELLQTTLAAQQQEREQSQIELERCELELAPLSDRIRDLSEKLQQLEESSLNQRWQEMQSLVQQAEQVLQESEAAIRQLEQQQQQLKSEQQLNVEKVQQQSDRIGEMDEKAAQLLQQCDRMQGEVQQSQTGIEQLEARIEVLSQRLAETRSRRDEQELQLRSRQQQAQRLEWDKHAAATKQQEKTELLQHLQQQLREMLGDAAETPPPEIPDDLTLEDLQAQIKRTEAKLRALEPVNMLAIEEHKTTQARVEDLRQKLETLQEERTELLLRIENFTTLRTQAFMDSFTAVNEHFRQIFAQLSDGDGQLQLENPADPLAGGLTLIAHPKGKPVRRLNSMSGGEKSLTALSFIFALQRFRPSSFYALDEVDAFLDGGNVEKLAAMVLSNSQQAQFVVVSHRRPMIERSERIIGVTQARGAYTQVVGVKNPADRGGQLSPTA
ncbi:chromosome segregation protein SMC [Synechococcus sp. PCC 7336]|uniref:chromosome segregation protein SMC n=1 Tax=Synechococcus sp. PCC 7336 TaxID=195250 RepID=UPI00034898E2|nr:chromosome segregation protein SMC [Synechococcus sp. PCC 7336]